MSELEIRQAIGISDSATFLPRLQDDSLSFRLSDGSMRHIVRTTGNPVWYNDGEHKLIDKTWVSRNNRFELAASKESVTVSGGTVAYQLGANGFSLNFPEAFQPNGIFLESNQAGLTVRLWAKGAKFEKWISGVGAPDLPLTQNNDYFIWSVPISGLSDIQSFDKLDVGTFKIRQGSLWSEDDPRIRVPIMQGIRNGRWVKLLPVEFFQPGMNWTTDGTTVYTTDGDGYVNSATTTPWSTVHDATSGTATFNDNFIYPKVQRTAGGNFNIIRGFAPADISGVSGTITAATFTMVTDFHTDGFDDSNGVITLTGLSSQASFTSLTANDYDNFGTTAVASSQDVTSLSDGSAVTFTITDLANTFSGGYAKVSVLSGYDFTNTAPGSAGITEAGFRSSNYTGTSSDPYYDITASAATIDKAFLLGVS